MPSYDYDLFVIGAGSGGVRAARMAAAHGTRVAIAEDLYVGGTCVNAGCIPKKLLVLASQYASEFRLASSYGWNLAKTSFDWNVLLKNKNREIARLNGIYLNILNRTGCELIEGHAVIVGPHTVRVGQRSFSTERILIATGSWPFVPDFPGREHVSTSNDVFHFQSLPNHVVIVGGGYVAVELAGIFSGLGAITEIVYRGDLFLRGFDDEVRTVVADEISRKGISLNFNTEILRIDRLSDRELRVSLKSGEEILTNCVIYATGRTPKVAGLGLENTAVLQGENGAIIVNDQFQTAEPSIFAIGDVIDRIPLTPVALAEAMHLVKHLYGGVTSAMDYDLIPTTVFCQPSIGTVGLTESQARSRYADVAVYKSRFVPLKNALDGSDERTFMKLIVDRESDRVVGVHMVGPDSGEIIQGIAIALKAGATKAVFDSTIGVHPTAAEEFVTMRDAAH
ncbi:glutathione-disulfide reductase [Pseudomonas indoloxydans]|uniref:Glutathione-disulfide reductase n=1 Tax=Ectopseudomonas oleovorans TaxID=301 RepID=A0A2T5PJ48_ECTOL|nr:glutathione-disulfide reductase [Pseudomonas indoloxydans]PTU77737.1 glutathione-disulfide reductase [Pseudomonas indoloxydans]